MMRPTRAAIGLVSAVIVVSSAVSTAPAFARHRVHKQHAVRSTVDNPAGDSRVARPDGAPLPGPRGPFAGAGGLFSPDYEVPGREFYHGLTSGLLGGELGNSYEDYYRHYYYYKYAYCPFGEKYVPYVRRCAGPGDWYR